MQKKKGVLLVILGVILLLELIALLVSVSFAVQLVLLSAAAAVILRFLFVDMKEQETKKKVENYMRRLR
jgi:membrane protein implicated in regulation of membrane protease activity